VETMTITKHFTAADFAADAATGDTTVVKHLAGGVSIRITMERDHHCDIPSPEVYTARDIAAWEAGEWTFWALDLSVWFGAHCIAKCAATIGGVDCVDDGCENFDHLADLANDLAAQADVPATVRSFSSRLAEAAALLDG
jgi:hypothetical protein